MFLQLSSIKGIAKGLPEEICTGFWVRQVMQDEGYVV
jgi:hypothetical protein